MTNNQCPILLGSNSPRRRELLAGLDIPFTAVSINADESYPSHLQAGDIPWYISRAKAQAFAPQLLDRQLLITSDTIVWLDGQMLGKSHDADEAYAMLRALSGKTHQVYTAVTFAEKNNSQLSTINSQLSTLNCQLSTINSQLSTTNSQLSTINCQLLLSTLVDKTDVTFAELSDEEIRYYIEKYQPFDKAGAYGIQEWIGYIGCTSIRGSYFNVMGFPVHLVYQELKKRGIIA